jgi:hypothetical protein
VRGLFSHGAVGREWPKKKKGMEHMEKPPKTTWLSVRITCDEHVVRCAYICCMEISPQY